jgi:hypothetical protein
MTPKLPIKILRRFSPEKLDSVFQDILEYNIEDKMNPKTLTHTISFKAFAKLVIDDMFNFLEDEKFFPIEEENYNETYRKPLLKLYGGRIKERFYEIESGINESVLKEERISGKKKLKGLVDEFGLFKASKIIGMSVTKLAEVTNTPIDSNVANQILVEMMNNDELKNKYKDFAIHASSNDVFYWEAMIKTGHFHDDMIENITIAATPFWDGVKYTPVEIEWFTLLNYYGVIVYEAQGEGGFYKELKHQTNFESVDELLNWYEEFYLPEVYNIIMNTLLPKMHKLVDYEIKQRG